MKHFTMAELCRSDTARAHGIENTPPPQAKVCLLALVNNVLDPVRELWGGPVVVNSGFRCPVLNRLVGGRPSSQHLRGEAADITVGSPEKNRRLFRMIESSGLPFDQLIDESGYRWIHISHAARNRRQVLHLK